MNVVRFMGGLGNQLYQYAFGQSLQLLGSDVFYDISYYSDENYKEDSLMHPFILHKFDIDIKFHEFINSKFVTPRKFPRLMKVDNHNFTGYWQDLKYCSQIIPLLKDKIKVRSEYHTEQYKYLKTIIENTNSLSIHIRRGDTLSKEYQQLSFQYYLDAIMYVKTNTNIENIFVFSDDIPWCREMFNDVFFVDLNDYLSFELMSFCKHNIICYSSYSKWAAFLNTNDCKIVVFPDMNTYSENNVLIKKEHNTSCHTPNLNGVGERFFNKETHRFSFSKEILEQKLKDMYFPKDWIHLKNKCYECN